MDADNARGQGFNVPKYIKLKKSRLLSVSNGLLSVSNGLLTENKSPFSLNVAKQEREFGLNINIIK